MSRNQVGAENIFKLVSLSHEGATDSENGSPIRRVYLGSACSEGEVLTQFPKVWTRQLKWPSIMAYRGHATTIYIMIAKEQVKDMGGTQTIIKSLIGVRDRLDKPVLATRSNPTMSRTGRRIYREIVSVVWAKGLWLTEPSVMVNMPNQHHATEGSFRTTNEMLDEFAFLGKICFCKLVIKHQWLGRSFWAYVEVVRVTCIPFIDGRKLTKKALKFIKSLPDIVEGWIEKNWRLLFTEWICVIYLASGMLCNVQWTGILSWFSWVYLDSVLLRLWLGLRRLILFLLIMAFCGQCQYKWIITDGSWFRVWYAPIRIVQSVV